MIEFFTNSERKARTEHVCSLCKKIIEPGSFYLHQQGKYEGDFYTTKLHKSCSDIIDAYHMHTGEDCWSPGEVYEWLCDYHCYGCGGYDDCEIDQANCGMVKEAFCTKKEVE